MGSTRQVVVAIPLLMLGLGTMAACGGPEAENGVATAVTAAAGGGAVPGQSPGGNRDLIAEMRRWAQCIREHGYDMPDPDPVEGKFVIEEPAKTSPEAERLGTARDACQQYDTFSDFREPMSAGELEAWLAYARCMRDQGVAVSDPDPDKGQRPLPPRELLRGQSPLLQKASEACKDEMQAARQARQR